MKNAFYPNDLARNGTGKCPACSDMSPHSGNLGQVLTRTWKEKKEHLNDICRTGVSESPSRPTANGDENGSIIGGHSGVPFPSNQSVAQSATRFLIAGAEVLRFVS